MDGMEDVDIAATVWILGAVFGLEVSLPMAEVSLPMAEVSLPVVAVNRLPAEAPGKI
jgi:hypothetical protein